MQIAEKHFHRAIHSFLVASLIASSVLAHPGSGIVVDRQGQVYFVDTGLGVWKIDLQGRLVRHEGPNYHWMAIDHEGRFSEVRLPEPLPRDVTVAGKKPALILGGDFPLTVGADGAMYYPQAGSDGTVRIIRLTPSRESSVFATLPEAFETGPDGRRSRAQWIHGLAAGSDGSLYYTEQRAVRKIDPKGSVTVVAENVVVPECHRPAAITEDRVVPSLRGLDVARDGTIYVAASACGALLKISKDGKVSVALRSADSWSPTGVAVSGGDLYVLEYLYVAGGPKEWVPRVRKVSADGKATVVASVVRG